MLARMRSLAGGLLRRGRVESGMAEEMRFHVEAYTEDLVRAGVPRAEAERRARIEFGGVEAIKEECRAARGLRLADELRQDLRYAFRTMKRTPGFTAVALLSLALGIGANTGIFTLLDAVLLKNLALRDPERLYFLGHGKDGSIDSNYPLFEAYRNGTESVFSGLAIFSGNMFKVSIAGGPLENVNSAFASAGAYELLGVPMIIGPGFARLPDRVPGGDRSAVISHAWWTRKYARDPGVIGKTITVEGTVLTIAGVTPPEFTGIAPGRPVDITVPISLRPVLSRGSADFFNRVQSTSGMPMVARLRPGIPVEQARAVADTVFQRFMADPEAGWPRKHSPEVWSRAELVPAGRGLDGLRKLYAKPLLVLMAMVGIVLLVACANVANLLLARAAARGREVAVRLAIGAGRWRLVRQFLTESLVLAAAGGALGLLLAHWITRFLAAVLAAGEYPTVLRLEPDARVLAFTATLSLLTGFLFGLAPALRGTRVDLGAAMKDGAVARRRSLIAPARLLVAGQISLCLVLLAGAGLLARTLWNLRTLDAGFEKRRVLLFNVDASALPGPARTQFWDALVARLRTLPGAVSASCSTMSPIGFGWTRQGAWVEGYTPARKDASYVYQNIVTPEYFATLGITLLRGRNFGPQDGKGAPNVLIVNEAMARTWFRGQDPVGRRVYFGQGPNGEAFEVIGVARDNLQRSLRDEPTAMVFNHFPQRFTATMYAVAEIRTSGDPGMLAGAVRREVQSLDRRALVNYVRTMSEQVDASLVSERLLAGLSGGMGVLALLLAAVGLYGVMAYSVARRTREIGIRVALGAERADVLRLVLRECWWLAAAGTALGMPAALVTTRIVSAMLYGVTPRDPATLAGAAAVIAGVVLLAGYLPARRAARVEPMTALRYE